MTDRPYTDADLRAEAARQHATLAEDPEFMCVGEQMQDQEVTPGGGVAWDDFSDETFDEAQRKIHDLINGAADVSEWAIQLGAAALTPHPAMAWQSTTGGYEVAVQVATAADLTAAARAELLAEIEKAVGETVRRVLGLKPAE
ncbi:hypothetical protein ACWDTP_38435 [Mycobacterium sp. NPDC003449]